MQEQNLIGKRVQVWCLNYIYTGTLTEVSDRFLTLTNAKIVYETGILTADEWADAQPTKPFPLHINLTTIESLQEVDHD